MNYQNDEDNDDFSQNLSSQEFKELAQNSNNINKSQSKVKSSIIYSMEQSNDEEPKRNIMSPNNPFSNRFDIDEKKDFSNINTENENLISQNEHEIMNLNEYESNKPVSLPLLSYLDTMKNNKENEIENSKVISNNANEDDFNNVNNLIFNKNNNFNTNTEIKDMKDNKRSSFSFSYNDIKNTNDDKNYYMNEINKENGDNQKFYNNEIDKNKDNGDVDINNKNNKINYNSNLKTYYNETKSDKNYDNDKIGKKDIIQNDENMNKNDEILKKRNIDIVNKILNDENQHYLDNEINNNYQAFLNEKLNSFQKELNANEEKNYENNVNKNEEDPYKLYSMNGNRKNLNIKNENTNAENYSFKKEIEEDKISCKNEKNGNSEAKTDRQKKYYYYSYDNRYKTTNFIQNSQKENNHVKGELNEKNNLDEENIPSENNYMKESKGNKKELMESEANINNRVDKKNLANNNTMIPTKENKVLNNINSIIENYKNYRSNNVKSDDENLNTIENKKDERNKENKSSNIDSNYFNKTTLIQKYTEREMNYNNERMEVVDTHSKYFKSKQNEQNPVALNKNIDNIKQNEYLNDDLINYNEEKNLYKENKALEKNPYNINKIASKNYKEGGNYPKFNDSISMNTLESVTIKKIDEDEERRTFELEQETKRLKDLEQEKYQLIVEEKEVRQKILEEIERQEMQAKEEKKKRMKLRYAESMKKKKEDEERLRQIKMKQELHLKEINELRQKKKMEEQKLLLLLEGKLNKQEIRNYRLSIQNEDIQNNEQENKTPFNIARDSNLNGDKFNENEKNRNEYEYINRDHNKYYSLSKNMTMNDNMNINNDSLFVEKQNNYKNKKMLNKSAVKSYPLLDNYFNNNEIDSNNLNENNNDLKKNMNKIQNHYSSKENMITISTINTIKSKSNQITINTTKTNEKDVNMNDYITFSPSLIPKKNTLSLNQEENADNNIITTELDQLISFSPVIKAKKPIINDYLNSNESNENNINSINEEDRDNSLYEKKSKKSIKRSGPKKTESNIKNKYYDKKNLKEKLINYQEKQDLNLNKDNDASEGNSFNELNQIKEITSKVKNDIDKKIEIINNENVDYSNREKSNISSDKILPKAKSSSKLNPFMKYQSSNYLSNRNTTKYLNGKKEIKTKVENTVNYTKFYNENNKEILSSRNNKYLNENEIRPPKQKSFMEDFGLPKEIRENQKSYTTANTSDYKSLNNKSYGNIGKTNRDKISDAFNFQEKIEKIEKIDDNRGYKTGSHRTYYKEYINIPDKNICTDMNENLGSEQNNSKLRLYYNEIYGENKK